MENNLFETGIDLVTEENIAQLENTETEKPKKPKPPKFSYSKLNVYESCAWKYKLTYVDKHFVDSSNINNEFGTLVHYIEENIGRDLIAGNPINWDKYEDLFINVFIEKKKKDKKEDKKEETEEKIDNESENKKEKKKKEGENILGILKLKEKYPEEFYTPDKSGLNYAQKAEDYLNFGMYGLYNFLKEHPEIELVDVEKPFDVNYNGKIFHGFIDRVMRNKITGELIIEDIKTWCDIKGHDVITPLQFVFYSLAAQEIYKVSEDKISCFYDLPLAKNRYAAGTKGFMRRGGRKIDKILSKIDSADFHPSPSPLCYWCIFSKTYPKQPEEAKNLCPYYSLYTKDNKRFNDVDFIWMGLENHEAIMDEFLKRNKKEELLYKKVEEQPTTINTTERRFILRK